MIPRMRNDHPGNRVMWNAPAESEAERQMRQLKERVNQIKLARSENLKEKTNGNQDR